MSPTTVTTPEEALQAEARPGLLRFLVAGIWFGIVLTKSEAVSWYRIQEMFRFQSIHMYGILGSAVLTAAVSIFVIRRLRLRTTYGDEIHVPGRPMTPRGTRFWLGGTAFGFGWALLGACPGPIYALIGAGYGVMVVGLLGALVGTFTYGMLRARLPH